MHARERSERRWLAGLLVLAALFWCFDLALLRAAVPDPLDDTWEYGVTARHLLAGDGFCTDVIHPPLWSLRDARSTVPVLVHGPLLPILIVPQVALEGSRAIDSVGWLAAAAAWIAAWLTFRLGARLFGPAVGAAAGGLFTLAPLTVRAVNHDPSLLVGAALLLAALDALTRARRAPGRAGWSAAMAGLALGLAALARAEMLIAAVVLLPLAGRRGAPAFLAGLLICVLPWWIHNARATGQPFFNLSSYLLIGYSRERPGLSVLRDFALSPVRFPHALRDALPGLPAKWAECFPRALKRALLAPTGGTGWLAPIGAALALGGRTESAPRPSRRVALLLSTLALIPIAIMTLTVYDSRYLTPFLPLWALAACRGAEALSNALPPWGRRPRAWIGVLLLALVPSVAPALKEAEHDARGFEQRLASERAALRAMADGSRRLIVSDTPDFVAFTTGRPVVWMTEAEFRGAPGAPGWPFPVPAADRWFHGATRVE